MAGGERSRIRAAPHPPDPLDVLAAHARQARDDRLWRRRVRRRRVIGGATAALLVLLTVTAYAVYVRLSPTSTTVVDTASAAPSAAASPTPSPSASPSPSGPTVSKAVSMYGKPRSGLDWHSGLWTGVPITRRHIEAAGTWRGTPMDFATVYPTYGSWDEIDNGSWAIANFSGFKGRLAYGLPLLPTNRKGKWQDVLSGAHDSVFTDIARDLVRYGHRDAAIRMGVEANGYWFPWAVDADTTDEFKAAFIADPTS